MSDYLLSVGAAIPENMPVTTLGECPPSPTRSQIMDGVELVEVITDDRASPDASALTHTKLPVRMVGKNAFLYIIVPLQRREHFRFGRIPHKQLVGISSYR